LDKHSNKGFSAIEIVIVVAILGVLSSVAVPSFMGWIANNKIESSAIGLRSVLSAARVQSISKGENTRVEFSAGSVVSCVSRIAEASCDSAIDADKLKTFAWDSGKVSVNSAGSLSTTIVFNPRGRLTPRQNTIIMSVCDDRGSANGYVLTVGQVGRASFKKMSDTTDGTCF